MIALQLLCRRSGENCLKAHGFGLCSRFSTQSRKENKSSPETTFDSFDGLYTPEAEEVMEKQEKFKEYVERVRNVNRLSKPWMAKNSWKNFSMPNVQILSKVEPERAWSKISEKMKFENEYDLTLEQKIKIFIERKTQEIEAHKTA